VENVLFASFIEKTSTAVHKLVSSTNSKILSSPSRILFSTLFSLIFWKQNMAASNVIDYYNFLFVVFEKSFFLLTEYVVTFIAFIIQSRFGAM